MIIAYLINKYVQNDTPLYPKDLKMRSRIDQRNHFDTGVLFAKLRELFVSKSLTMVFIVYLKCKKNVKYQIFKR